MIGVRNLFPKFAMPLLQNVHQKFFLFVCECEFHGFYLYSSPRLDSPEVHKAA